MSYGKTARQMVEDHRAWADLQPLRVSCAWCPRWSFTGPAGEAVAAAAAHRASEHPLARGRRRYSVPGRYGLPSGQTGNRRKAA